MSYLEGLDDGTGYGVVGRSRRGGYGVVGETPDNIAVYGISRSSYGVYGLTWSGHSVAGRSNSGYGVLGESLSNYGVIGGSYSSIGVYGTSNIFRGVYGRSDFGYGVYGYSRNGVAGVYGYSPKDTGVYGETRSGYGVLGRRFNDIFVEGEYGGSSQSSAVFGRSDIGAAVYGSSDNSYGVLGESHSSYGVYGNSYYGHGVYAISKFGLAALLDGHVTITGNLQKGGGSFKIDHPLDPANKYLSHSFVESPDMKNVYDGVVILDNKGEAEIEFPDWFGALNKDFRYQLTAIGAPGPNLYIAEKISDTTTSNKDKNNDSRFKIAGGASGMEVSWQVTGIRKDPWANANRIEVEEDKPTKERSYYLHPDVYGQPKEKGISHLLALPKIKATAAHR
jgi:hypothetical protein